MFLDAFYKHLQGFFDLALLNCKADRLPQWWFVISPLPIIGCFFAYVAFAGWWLPRRRGNRQPMNQTTFKRLNTVYTVLVLLANVYINFNTLVVFNQSSKAGSKLMISTDCSICSCFLVMWFNVFVQIAQAFGDALMSDWQGQNVNCVLVMYNALKFSNAWIAFQFYQRESAILTNIITLADALAYGFAWFHRNGNAIARSISPTPELRVLTAAQSVLSSTVAGFILIATQDLDQRFLWWTLEYNMISMVLMGLLCGWREFKLCLMFICTALFEFFIVGMYAVFNRDLEFAECAKNCVQRIAASRIPPVVGLGPLNGAESGVIGPVQP